MASGLSRVLDMVLPPVCGACGQPGPSPCAGCHAALRPAPPGPRPAAVDQLVAVLAYEGQGRELVARLKYRNTRSTVPWLATAMAEAVEAAVGAGAAAPEAVTWAPTTPARRRRRGFDQAELLATGAGRILHLPTRRLLRRTGGGAQTGRSGAERRTGPGFVAATQPVPGSVLLVDDVVTTGATFTAAARALRAAGAHHVMAVAAARTPAHAPTHAGR